MKRRTLFALLAGLPLAPVLFLRAAAREESTEMHDDKVVRSDEEWRKILTPEQYHILREEGTERHGTSELLHEKRAGTYACAGCGQALFDSETKYDSGTGWPSFFDHLAGALGSKRDFKLIWPRTEYHCSRCGGHQGHVFDDGPKPTGLRYCNNGIALTFIPRNA